MPQHLQEKLRAELKPGEIIVWSGQPDADRYMKSGFKIWFFFIPWTAFSLFWMAGASGFELPRFDDGWSLFPLFGLPFLLIGVGGLSSPLWMRRKAYSTIYAVTNQRAITIEGGKTVTVKSYPVANLKNVERVEHSDGSGDLILITGQYRDSDGDNQIKRHGFMAVDNVKRVQSFVDKLIESNNKA